MRDGRRSVRRVSTAAAAAALLTCGCSATKTGPGASPAGPGPAGPARFSGISFQAELAPISALAWEAPYLWMGSDRGLRRVRVSEEKVEWISLAAPAAAPPMVGPVAAGGAGGAATASVAGGGASASPEGTGRRVTALASASEGGVWVGTDSGLGRVTDVGGQPTFRPVAALEGITQVAPCASTSGTAGAEASDAVWIGTNHGLFFAAGGAISPITAVGKVAITFLSIDADGRSVWAGVRGRGLLLVAGRRVVREVGPAATPPIDFLDPVGISVMSNGTPFTIGRSRDGATKLVKLHPVGAEPLETEPTMKVWALLTTAEGPLAFVSRPGPGGLAPGPGAVYRLAPIERGERLSPGAFRFVQGRGNLHGLRVAAQPDSRGLPVDVTTWIATEDEVFVGTRAAGAARLGDALAVEEPASAKPAANAAPGSAAAEPAGAAPVPPEYLPVGEVTAHATALSVACLERDRCVIATGAGPGWIWDAQTSIFLPVPHEALGGPLMALGGDGAGAVYFMAADGPKGIKVARLSADGARWDPLLTVQVTTEDAPVVSTATVSPTGSLWMSIRSRAPSGEESGRGVIELQLPSGKSIHHHAARAGEPRSPQAVPVSGDVRAVRFQTGTSGSPDAIWFCTSLGVLRTAAGDTKPTHWSENDGLTSDSCSDLTILADGSVWAATNRGAARFDGKTWVPFEGQPSKPGGEPRWPRPRHRVAREGEPDEEDDVELLAARAFVSVDGVLWAGSPRGVWPLTSTGRPFDDRTGLVDENVRDLVLDRFGRLWVMGQLGLTVTDKFPRL